MNKKKYFARYYVYIIEQPLEVSSGLSTLLTDDDVSLGIGLIEFTIIDSFRMFVSDRDFINLLPVISFILLLSSLCGSFIADVELSS